MVGDANTNTYCSGAVVVDHSPLEIQETYMSKGMDRKKDTKKKPAKTLMEKRVAKKQKKDNKPFPVVGLREIV